MAYMFFYKFYICLFLFVLRNTKHTAHVCGSIKTLKHKDVGPMLRFAYYGCENLAHTSKTC